MKLTGYYEADWLGTGVTSNNRQSNSYVLRQRQIWGQAKTDSGWSFTGGQQWTLATEDRKGIDNRQEAIPLTIDPQYTVGFTWARQYGFRVVKNFGDKFALAVSVEGPQATIGGRGFSNVTTINNSAAPSVIQPTGGTSTRYRQYLYRCDWMPAAVSSTSATPPVIRSTRRRTSSSRPRWIRASVTTKCSVSSAHSATASIPAAWLAPTRKTPWPRQLRRRSLALDAAAPTTVSSFGAFNDSRTGGGFGASARWTAAQKKVELGLKAVAGDGIGRYGSAQLADLTIRPDGSEALIRTVHGLGALELHPTPKLDLYAYYGAEYAFRAAYSGYDSITKTITAAIPATATSPAIPSTTADRTQDDWHRRLRLTVCQQLRLQHRESGALTSSTRPAGGTCAGDTKVIWEGTLGFWHKIYNGPKGGLRWGIQYSYITRTGWSGNNNVLTVPGIAPKAVDNMIFTSFRYYIP